MAEDMVRLGYNEGPPSVAIGGAWSVTLTRGQKSDPVPLKLAANLLAFSPKSYVPLVFPETDRGTIDADKLRAEVKRVKEERAKLTAYQKIGITITDEQWKAAYSPGMDAETLARSLGVPIGHVRAFARMNSFELAPAPKLEKGFGVSDLKQPEPQSKPLKPKSTKEGGSK